MIVDDLKLENKKYRDNIEDELTRINNARTFLKIFKPALSLNVLKLFIIQVVRISDPFGPTITDPCIEALVVTQETKNGGFEGKFRF